jgi:hypothetical protein
MENYRKKYYIKNIEKFRNYYENNKEKLLEYEKLYYQQNRTEIRDKQRAYFQKYYLLNKEIINNNSLQRYYNINYSHPSYIHNNDSKISGLSNFNNELLDQNIIIRFTDD